MICVSYIGILDSSLCCCCCCCCCSIGFCAKIRVNLRCDEICCLFNESFDDLSSSSIVECLECSSILSNDDDDDDDDDDKIAVGFLSSINVKTRSAFFQIPEY
ncbi:hypothetical protein DERP_005313 [Dermatophagoides pteronyssinus]|uniref:Secreted protein n=1 Tax=Dermatophagoides pteronyssinus TaxID=6956 RepID=A0ABQ8JMS7_DERPT|nr:hypothetical protein DERP_005313 [Dermatophagoides pteronyssinus]